MCTSSNFPFSKLRTSSGSSKRLRIVSMFGIKTISARGLARQGQFSVSTGNRELVSVLLHYLRVRRQRQQREVLAVQVIHQVEHTREAGSRVELLIPGAVFTLRAHQV